MYESMVFYKSFYEAIKDLEIDIQNEIFNAIFRYGLYGEEPNDLTPVANSIFILIKPQIDANNRRKENGKKGAEFGKLGGRPKKETPNNVEKNPKKTPPKPQKNPTETPNVNVKVNDNVNVKVKVKNIYGEYAHVKLTDEEFNKLKSQYDNVDELIKFLDEYIEEKGYKSKSHYLAIKRWVVKAVEEKKPFKKNGFNDFQQSKTDLDEMEQLFLREVNST